MAYQGRPLPAILFGTSSQGRGLAGTCYNPGFAAPASINVRRPNKHRAQRSRAYLSLGGSPTILGLDRNMTGVRSRLLADKENYTEPSTQVKELAKSLCFFVRGR